MDNEGGIKEPVGMSGTCLGQLPRHHRQIAAIRNINRCIEKVTHPSIN